MKLRTFAAGLGGLIAGLGLSAVAQSENFAAPSGLLTAAQQAAALIQRDYLYPTDPEQLDQAALDGVLLAARLSGRDPYSRVVSRQEVELAAREANSAGNLAGSAARNTGVSWSEGPTGVLVVSSFLPADTEMRIDQALSRLKASGTRRLIIDLRDNSGGRLEAAEHLAERLMSSGEIARYHGRNERIRLAHKESDDIDWPVTVLINQQSASGSELVAQTLRRSRGAAIIGQRSRGKSRVQSRYELSSGAELILTTERWDAGSDVEGQGIKPDTVSELRGGALTEWVRQHWTGEPGAVK